MCTEHLQREQAMVKPREEERQTVLSELSQLPQALLFPVDDWIKRLQQLQSDGTEGGDLIN